LAAAIALSGATQAPSPQRQERECEVTIMRGGEVDRKVRILDKPAPKFSDEEVRKHGRGVIVLVAVFCGSGKVTDLRVRQGSNDALNQKAIDAARRIRFVPAEKDGQKVSQWVNLEYHIAVYSVR
jgi:TonB family protein